MRRHPRAHADADAEAEDVSAPALSALQTRVRDRVVALLEGAGVEAGVREKRETRSTEDPFESEVAAPAAAREVERVLVIRFSLGDARFEVWAYADSAGVMEPGEDWWPFDRDDFDEDDELVEAVCAHVRDILEEAGEP